MNKSEGIYGQNWIFVGNHHCREDITEQYASNGIKFRLGEVAYDIHGVKIPTNYMLPLFIAKESFQKYDDMMMNELRKIRSDV